MGNKIKHVKNSPRKFTGKCETCGKVICPSCSYVYTDDTNAALDNNSPYLCRDCYEKRHGRIRTEKDVYKERLVGVLMRAREQREIIEIDRLIELIANL